jgi:hypothetical protein
LASIIGSLQQASRQHKALARPVASADEPNGAPRIARVGEQLTLRDMVLQSLLALLCVSSLAALALLIRAVLRMLRASRLLDVPVLERQHIEFPSAGRVVLCLEGPRFSPRLGRLEYALHLPGGAEVAGHRILFRTVTSSISKARISLREYDLPYPGRYELAIRGLAPGDAGAPRHRVVFMRPHLLRTVLLVVGITVSSALAITGLVLLLLTLVPTAAAIDPGRATGYLVVNGTRIELREAYAHLHGDRDSRLPFAPELRIVLADREIAQESLRGPETLPVVELALSGEVRGLLIRADPDDTSSATVTILAAPAPGSRSLITHSFSGTGQGAIRELRLSPQRVGGDIVCPPDPGLQCSAHFSAPLFND